MLLIEALDILATGSSDTIIRLFENKRKLTNSHKELRGHSKAIKALAYCS
jgi:WD40 repeat protein